MIPPVLHLQLSSALVKLQQSAQKAEALGVFVPARITQSINALNAMLGVAEGFIWPANITIDSFIESASQIAADLEHYSEHEVFGSFVVDALTVMGSAASIEASLRDGSLATAVSFPVSFGGVDDAIVVGAWRGSGSFAQYVAAYVPPPPPRS